jgi:hypothetical protein
MTTTAIRKKLHNFINTADDKQVKAVYSIFENEITGKSKSNNPLTQKQKLDVIKKASTDPLFLADLKEISDDFAIVDNENI